MCNCTMGGCLLGTRPVTIPTYQRQQLPCHTHVHMIMTRPLLIVGPHPSQTILHMCAFISYIQSAHVFCKGQPANTHL